MDAVSIDLIIGFLTKQCAQAVEQNAELAVLLLSDPKSIISVSTEHALTGNILEDILESPLGQMGQNILINKVSEAIGPALDKVHGDVSKFVNNLDSAYQAVFNTLIAAMLVQQDMILYMLQQLAKTTMKEIDHKRVVVTTLQDQLRQIHNAMVIACAGPPQYQGYLGQIRKALLLIVDAQNNLQLVRDTYDGVGRFLTSNFNQVQTDLQQALELVTPKKGQNDVQFNVSFLLETIGVPRTETQINAMLSLPQLAKQCLITSEQYLLQTAKVDALIAAFLAGLGVIKGVVSDKIDQYAVSVMDSALSQMATLISSMAVNANGGPNYLNRVQPGFQTAAHIVMGNSLDWILQIKSIQQTLALIPVKGLQAISLTDAAVHAYENACKVIRGKGNRQGQLSFMKASEGQESAIDMESQLTSFLAQSQTVILTATVPRGLLSLSTGMIERCQLSLDQDIEIKTALQTFANYPLPNTLAPIMNGITSMLSTLGLDRAADLLKSGNYADFFNTDSKTATYIGAAMVGLSVLQQCLGPINFPIDLLGILKNFYFSFMLRFQRTAANSIKLQINANLASLDSCAQLQAKIRGLGSVCGLKDALAPSSMYTSLSGALGMGNAKRITG